MLRTIGTELLIGFVLMLANGFFSGSEVAVVSARKSRLHQQATAESKSARQALELAENPDRFLVTVHVAITLISTCAAAFGGARIRDAVTAWLGTFPLTAPAGSTPTRPYANVIVQYNEDHMAFTLRLKTGFGPVVR